MENEEIRREAAYRMEQLEMPQWVIDDFRKGTLYVNNMIFATNGPYPLEHIGDFGSVVSEIASLEERYGVMIFTVVSNGISGCDDNPYSVGAGKWRSDQLFRYLCVSRDPTDWPAEREMAQEGEVKAIIARYSYDLIGYSIAEVIKMDTKPNGSCLGGALACYAIPGGEKVLYAPDIVPVARSYETATVCVGCYEGEEILSLL